MTDDGLREELGKLVRQLVAEQDETEGEKLHVLLRDHLGEGAVDAPVLTEELQDWVRRLRED